ncbi:MAG: hypothetical protein ACRDNW_08345 [Trebonia sp.]
MQPSLSQPDLGTHPFGDTQAEERLRGLDRQQLADRLTWLSWWAPGTFTVVISSPIFDVFAVHAAGSGPRRGHVI